MAKLYMTKLIDEARCSQAVTPQLTSYRSRQDVCRRRRHPCQDKAHNQRIITHIDRLIFAGKSVASIDAMLSRRCVVSVAAAAAHRSPENRSFVCGRSTTERRVDLRVLSHFVTTFWQHPLISEVV